MTYQPNLAQNPIPAGGSRSTHAVKSVAVVSIGGHTYPLVSQRRCKVCNSPKRFEIESALVKGAGFHGAATTYGDDSITGRNVRMHFQNGHLPLAEAALAKVKKQQAREYAELIESGADSLANLVTGAQSVIGKVSMRLLEGDITPTFHEGLQAAKLIARTEEAAMRSQGISTVAVLHEVMQIVETEVSAPVLERVRDRFFKHPVLSRLLESRGR
jgi:hypothetical protein